MEYITLDEFKKLDIRVGTIKKVEIIPNSNKLLKTFIDFGDKDEKGEIILKVIVSGILEYYPNFENLVGKQLLYILNIEPRVIYGVKSEGMLLAVGDREPIFLIPEKEVTPGSKVR